MSTAARLAEERRARLAAERLLELKQAELFAANRKLNKHARQLSHEITETRAVVADMRNENQRVKSQLGEAHEKIELVEGQLWKALQTVRDGFAMFNSDRMLELANPAYLAVFEDLDTIRPGASYHHVLDMMVEEGIVDLQGEEGDHWRARMRARWDHDPIPSETIRLWTGQFIKIQERHMPDGGIVSLSVDITDLMRMWSAVEELPDGFVIYDPEDRLLMCNEPYRQIYATSAPAIVPGATFEEILRYGLQNGQYPEAAGSEDDWLEQRLGAHRATGQELEQQLDNGRWLRVYERPLSDGGRVGLRIDITDTKKVLADLEEARRRAEIASRAKSTFLANMSHEIRTPMNGVVGMADLLLDSDLTEEQQLYLQTIRSSGEALLVIINDVLDYSKIEADKLTLAEQPFDLERAVHEVMMLLQPTARDKEIELLVDYDMFLPTRFVGDPGRVRQILTNLVGNAVKFTSTGHVLVRVTGTSGDGEITAVHLAVEDTGIGIEPDKLDLIFGEFNQVDDDRNREFEGTGLGLAITQRLVRLMGGDTWVDSELGRGSCFGLRILLQSDEDQIFETARIRPGFRTALVVDDHATNRAILSKQLQTLGLTPQFCKTANEALDSLIPPPDVIIAEMDLPGMDGLELARHLSLLGSDLPVILISANPGAAAGMTEDLNIVDVLQKPAPRRLLFSALEAASCLHAEQSTLPAPHEANAESGAEQGAALGTEASPQLSPPEQTDGAIVLQDSAPPAPTENMQFERASDPAPHEHALPESPPTQDTFASPEANPPVLFRHRNREPAPRAPEPALPEPTAGFRPLDVLLAEDNRTNQLVFRKMAQKLGVPLDLRLANNGIEAVAAYRKQRPDLIFMDISMPRMDGKQATQEIRLIEGDGPRTPIIAVTAHAMAGDRDAIIEAGLDDYLTKPLRRTELDTLIRKWGLTARDAAPEPAQHVKG